MKTRADRKPFFLLHSTFCTLHWGPLIALTCLTTLAALLRFSNLSHPCLWYDESMVFWRTCGSYSQLLDCLRTDGFVPLHYSLIWFLSQHFRPTPLLLRFVPALSGTLMVPAIYFLARQLFPIRTALLAAAFAACSAFLLFYSRDAKMYMDAWLLVTLNMACLLWWFREKTSTAWLSWIATGCAACGLHASSAIPIGISLLLLLTQSAMRWPQMLLWLAGIIVIFAGPVGYYETFNRWEDRVDEDGWKDSGLTWINDYNRGRTGPELVRYFATTTLMGWEWPKDQDLQFIQPARISWPARAAKILLVILIAGCFPWPRRYPAMPVPRYSEEPDLGAPEPGGEPQWRIALWLSFWIILPVYAFYCRSMPRFISPLDLENLLQPTRFRFVLLAATLAALIGLMFRYPHIRPKVYRGIKLLFVIAAILTLCQCIAIVATHLSDAAAKQNNRWQSLWVPRYIGFIWPALALAGAASIMRLPTRYLRDGAIIFLLGVNLATAAYRILGQTEPPVDLMAADMLEAQNPTNHTLTWMHIKRGMQYPGGGNLFSGPGQYYLDLFENKPTTPVQFRVAMQAQRIQIRIQPLRKKLAADLVRIIIWDQHDVIDKPAPEDYPPSDWKLESENWFNTRDCWIWQDLSKYHRRVLVKQ